MEILNIPFEEKLTINYKNSIIEIFIFKTTEKNNVKFGINANSTVKIYREEIYNAILQQQLIDEK